MRLNNLIDYCKDYFRENFPLFSYKLFFAYLLITEIPGAIIMFFIDGKRNSIEEDIYWIFAIATLLLIVERAIKKSTDLSLILISHALIASPLLVLYLYTGLLYQYPSLDHMDAMGQLLYLLGGPFLSTIIGVLITLFIAIITSFIFQKRIESKRASRGETSRNSKNDNHHSNSKNNENNGEQKKQTSKQFKHTSIPKIPIEEAAVSKYDKVLGFNPYKLTQLELKKRLLTEQKKWIRRTSAPNLKKRQEAENMLELLMEIERELIK